MTGSLKYKPSILNFSYHQKFPAEDVFQSPGLSDVIFRMTGSIKYKTGILSFSSQLKLHEKDVF